MNSFLCENGLLRAHAEWGQVSGRAGPLGRQARCQRSRAAAGRAGHAEPQNQSQASGDLADATALGPAVSSHGEPTVSFHMAAHASPRAVCRQSPKDSRTPSRSQPWGGRIWLQSSCFHRTFRIYVPAGDLTPMMAQEASLSMRRNLMTRISS